MERKPPSLTGTSLGEYEVLEELGRGGMGVVYRALDKALDRTVALKVIKLSAQDDDRLFLKRFQIEARTAAKLEHPNVVRIYNFGGQYGATYIAMEYVEGETLSHHVGRTGRLPLSRALEITLQATKGLQAAHRLGIVHRDIKPENLMITRDGHVKILDFGLAKLLSSQSTALTQKGTILGTPKYMSPEQWDGHPLDARTDIYSLGAVLYFMLAGRAPFEARTPLMLYRQVLEDPPPPISQFNDEVPEQVGQILVRTLAKKPEGRYAATKDFSRDIQLALTAFSATGRGSVDEETGSESATELIPSRWYRKSGAREPRVPAEPDVGLQADGREGASRPLRRRYMGLGALVGLAIAVPLIWSWIHRGDNSGLSPNVSNSGPIPESTFMSKTTALSIPQEDPVPEREEVGDPSAGEADPPTPLPARGAAAVNDVITPPALPILEWDSVPEPDSVIRLSRVRLSWRVANEAIVDGFLFGMDDPNPNLRLSANSHEVQLFRTGERTVHVVPISHDGAKGPPLIRRFIYQPNRSPLLEVRLEPMVISEGESSVLHIDAYDADDDPMKFETRIDRADWRQYDDSPITIRGLAPGSHFVEVRALDDHNGVSQLWTASLRVTKLEVVTSVEIVEPRPSPSNPQNPVGAPELESKEVAPDVVPSGWVEMDIDRDVYIVGEQFRFTVRVERACYLTVAAVNPDGSGLQLFPNAFTPDGYLAAGAQIRIPDSDPSPIIIEPPLGIIRIVAFAFPREIPFIGRISAGNPNLFLVLQRPLDVYEALEKLNRALDLMTPEMGAKVEKTVRIKSASQGEP